ncbi:hypothetical protein [Cohaesibacter intestini]|uniref:hypothetical protein n=1 Tax=Cohaesibacter intestini TaxID=2211145 RepID=UPI000DE846F3|nr:hypothetical protein [Cohaesibacter intestini]
MNKPVTNQQHGKNPSRDKRGGVPSDADLLAPYKSILTFDQLTEIHQNRLLKFLHFAHVRNIKTPTKQDFLDFSIDREPAGMLIRLREVFQILFPGHPMIVFDLNEAILEKTRIYEANHRAPRQKKRRKPAQYSIDIAGWPANWQAVWHQMQSRQCPSGHKPFAESTLQIIQEVLSGYVWALTNAGLPIEINVENLKAYEEARKERAPKDEEAAYMNQGKRAETFRTATRRLIQFGTELGIDPAILDNFRIHEKFLEKAAEGEESLKYGRLGGVPDYRTIYRCACTLLLESSKVRHRKSRCTLRNEAAVIALWMFMPLRLTDGQLRWGSDIDFRGGRYCIDVSTNKTGKRIMVRLHPKIDQFFDALILGELSHDLGPAQLALEREKLVKNEMPVFRTLEGKMLHKKFPSRTWNKHFGTGAHIARTKAHTELGKQGEAGMNRALALCAQTSFKTRLHYQAEAVDAAMVSQSQDMMDDMIAEAILDLDSSEEEE